MTVKQMIQAGSAGVLGAIVLLYAIAGISNIDPGEVGILVKMLGSDRGMQKETLSTGMHWIDPFTYDVVVYDARSRQFQEGLQDIPSQTKDGQPILVDLSLELSLVPSKVPDLHEKVGRGYFQQVVYPDIRSAVRNTTTTQLSDEIYTGQGRATVQENIQKIMEAKLSEFGINIKVNLRDVDFTNQQFVKTLELKAEAAQKVIIEKRNAEAAEQTAIKNANLAEGDKQKRIKAAEADREERRLKGEGDRLEKEETAKGILAIAKAEAEGTKLRREALAGKGGAELVSIEWAKNLGPNVKVYGVPTGSPGTTNLMDLNGLVGGAFKGVAQ